MRVEYSTIILRNRTDAAALTEAKQTTESLLKKIFI